MKKGMYVLFVLCFLVHLCLSPITAFAASPSYTLEGKTVSPGETFTMDIGIQGNPGIISLRLSVTYSDDLELLSVADKELLNGWTAPSPTLSSPYTLRWTDSFATVNNTSNGNIVTLTFKAKNTTVALSSDVVISHVEARNADGTKVEFANMSATVKINPTPAVLTSISVKNTPNKTNYFVGDLLDVTGLMLTATYNNGSTETITSGFTFSPTTLNTVGTQKITVTYQGKTATFNVTVTEVVLSSIAIKTNPTKMSYYVGDIIDTTGLTLTATYNNGATQTVTEGFTYTPASLDTAGTQLVTIHYGSKTTTFNIEVTMKPVLELISSSEYQINTDFSALTGVNAQTTAADIIAQFTDDNIFVYNNGALLENDALVGTGCIVKLMDEDGTTVLDSLTIVVQGDLDGDGKVRIDDARKALRAAVGLEIINEFQSLAADIDKNGKVQIPDVRTVLRVAVGLEAFSV